MAINGVKIRFAKPGASIRKLSDGNGLQLWVAVSGSKHWKLAYRSGGRQKTLSLAVAPYPKGSFG